MGIFLIVTSVIVFVAVVFGTVIKRHKSSDHNHQRTNDLENNSLQSHLEWTNKEINHIGYSRTSSKDILSKEELMALNKKMKPHRV